MSGKKLPRVREADGVGNFSGDTSACGVGAVTLTGAAPNLNLTTGIHTIAARLSNIRTKLNPPVIPARSGILHRLMRFTSAFDRNFRPLVSTTWNHNAYLRGRIAAWETLQSAGYCILPVEDLEAGNRRVFPPATGGLLAPQGTAPTSTDMDRA
jgi:hypothetical protein